MSTQEAKKKNQETLKLLNKEKKNLKKIEKTVSELKDSLRKESSRLREQIEKLGYKSYRDNIVRIGDTAYSFDYSFLHGLRQNECNELDLYDTVDQIISPSVEKSHLGFKVGEQIRLKQEGFVPFRYKRSTNVNFNEMFFFPAGVDIVEKGSSHYVLGVSLPKEVKNPILLTRILCFYEDGKALVYHYITRSVYPTYYEVVDLSNYESCSHLEWDSKKGLEKSFAKYLEANGLTEKIKFEDKFGFSVGESIYVKSHEEIILDNPTISDEKFERALGKDLHFMQSLYVKSESIGSGGWKVFGFVGDKVLVECNNTIQEFSHFELFSPEEINLIIDLDYRLKKEKYFDKITKDKYGNISKIK